MMTMETATNPSTSTISTIAIRAGNHSTIAIAFLKSTEYVSLKICDMQPNMLEIGENAYQTSNLLNIHDDLMKKLKSKEDQVEELLARADNLVTQQKPSDVAVYEAMAESLGTAWKELNRQLHMRGFLLDETMNFYTLVEKHAKITSETRNLLELMRSGRISGRVNDSMRDVKSKVDEQIDVTAAAINSGADVISQIRLLGSLSDNPETNADIASACLMIEKYMLKMGCEWEALEEAWKATRSNFENHIDQSGTILAHVEEIEKWLVNAKAQQASRAGLDSLYEQALRQRIAIENIVRSLNDGQLNAGLGGRCIQLQIDVENFTSSLVQTKKAVQSFISSCEAVLNQLNDMEVDMKNANDSMAGELAPLARQKVRALTEEGQKHESHDSRVPNLLSELQQRLYQIENLAQQRITTANQIITGQLDEFETWLNEIEEGLISNNRISANQQETSNLLAFHEKILAQILQKEDRLNYFYTRSKEFTADNQKRYREITTRFTKLKKMTKNRIEISAAYQENRKFAHDLENSFDSLEALIDDSRHTQDGDRISTQISSIFKLIEDTLYREHLQGENFISAALLASNEDSHLNINEAIDSVKRTLKNHEQRKIVIDNRWENWKVQRVRIREVVRIVEEIQIWQDEVTEVIRTMKMALSKPTLVEERKKLKKKMDEVIRSLPKHDQKIQETLSMNQQSSDRGDEDKVERVQRRQEEIENGIREVRERIETIEELEIQEITETRKAPVILTQLRDSQIDEGGRFEFSVKIDSKDSKDPSIRWFKDNRDVNNDSDYRTSYVNNVATLTIEETFIEDTAVYTIRVENEAGSTESSAKLIVKSRSELGLLDEAQKPRFIRPLRNLSVNEGQTAKMDCVLHGLPEPKVVWFKEDEAIKESDRVKLFFENDHCYLKICDAVQTDSGFYFAKASNVHGEATTFCRITVHPCARAQPPPTPPKPRLPMNMPMIQPSLFNQVLLAGQQCIFQVRISGEPKPHVYWKFNDSIIQSTDGCEIVDDHNGWYHLTLDIVDQKRAGMYTVVAENDMGEARSGATLFVDATHFPPPRSAETNTPYSEGFMSDTALLSSPTPPPIPKHRDRADFQEYTEKIMNDICYSPAATAPEFIRPFQNEFTLIEGERFRAECLMIGNPRPKVQLYFNDRLINFNNIFCNLSNIGDTYTISFENVTMQHNGIYKMTAENIRGQTESVFVMLVKPKSLAMQQKQVRSERFQTSEEFLAYECMEQNIDHRMIHKTEIDDAMEHRRQATKQTTHTESGTPPPTKKQSLLQSQEMSYRDKYAVGDDWQMDQNRPPHFSQTLVSSIAVHGEKTKFEGLVTGWPSPEIMWTKEGEILSKQSRPELTFSNVDGRVSLEFPSARTEYAGKYMCTAKNASGVATSSAQLVVRPQAVAPDFVRRLMSEEVQQGVRLKWTIEITGDPAPSITWLRDGEVMTQCDGIQLLNEGNGVFSMVIEKVGLKDSSQFTCLAENFTGEARSTADLVVRPEYAEPGNYFHITKVTQEKRVKGEEVSRNESFAIENPLSLAE